jgi:Ras-related protein Rap-1B
MRTGHGFLLVFSITSLSSLRELQVIRDQINRVKTSSTVPIVLVGNKSDLEEDRAVSRSRAFQVSQQWGRVPYYETSARRRANVDEVFVDLCRQIIRKDMERGVEFVQHQGGSGEGSSSRGSRKGSSRDHDRELDKERDRDRERRKKKGKRRMRRKDEGSSCTIL